MSLALVDEFISAFEHKVLGGVDPKFPERIKSDLAYMIYAKGDYAKRFSPGTMNSPMDEFNKALSDYEDNGVVENLIRMFIYTMYEYSHPTITEREMLHPMVATVHLVDTCTELRNRYLNDGKSKWLIHMGYILYQNIVGILYI